jgi:hypothetical protein
VVVVDRGGAAARHASEAINERGGRSIPVVADLLALLVSPLGVLPRVMAVLIFQRRIVAGRTAGGVN